MGSTPGISRRREALWMSRIMRWILRLLTRRPSKSIRTLTWIARLKIAGLSKERGGISKVAKFSANPRPNHLSKPPQISPWPKNSRPRNPPQGGERSSSETTPQNSSTKIRQKMLEIRGLQAIRGKNRPYRSLAGVEIWGIQNRKGKFRGRPKNSPAKRQKRGKFQMKTPNIRGLFHSPLGWKWGNPEKTSPKKAKIRPKLKIKRPKSPQIPTPPSPKNKWSIFSTSQKTPQIRGPKIPWKWKK